MGGWQRPGFHPDGLPLLRQTGNLHPMAVYRPKQIPAIQGIKADIHQLAVPSAHLLGDVENHGGLQLAEAIHVYILNGKILRVNWFHNDSSLRDELTNLCGAKRPRCP